jgi:hypothetical protein
MAYRGPSFGTLFGFIWRFDVALWLWGAVLSLASLVVCAVTWGSFGWLMVHPDNAVTQSVLETTQSVILKGADKVKEYNDRLVYAQGTDPCSIYRKDAWNLTYGPKRTEESQAIALQCEDIGEGVGIPQNDDAAANQWAYDNREMGRFVKLPEQQQRALVFEAAKRLGLRTTDIPGRPETRGNYSQAYDYAQKAWDAGDDKRHRALVARWNPQKLQREIRRKHLGE